MKRNLLLSAMAILICISCSKEDLKETHSKEDLEETPIADVTISMRAIDTGSEITLDLWDTQGNTGTPMIKTKAEPNFIIRWELDEDSKINKILNIYKKEHSADIFEVQPYRVSHGIWEAKVAPWAANSIEYNIDFEYEDGSVVVIDPFIEIPPKK
ncbi:hypothetical protein [Saccharicrinis aurantiacus]|uniref:hypothetical protein n=1 Tax=Saccharicrinis aurantiacus TaxID=1849719 RepID=UPI0024903FB1|nr:hypothetical protein [Saccharicrinis aurantiacus]